MDILKEQILRAKELMGIVSEQTTQKSRKELEECFTEVVRKGNEGLYLEKIEQPCWDNVLIPMITTGVEIDCSDSSKGNCKELIIHCKGNNHDRIRVIRLGTYLPEIQECL